jgi:hypothetical protein
MGQQVRAEESTRRRRERAGLPDPSVQRAMEQARGGEFLGPQLPAPWGDDLLAGRRPGGERDREGEEEGVLEAMEILSRGSKDPGQSQRGPLTKQQEAREDLALAFLRSSHTGIGRKPAVVMARPPPVHPASALRGGGAGELTREQRNRDYLSTQV